MDPIMMDEEQTREIIRKERVACSGKPYQYKINKKNREVAEREGLDSDEEEVEDLHVTRKIEEILCATYDRKTRGQGFDITGGSPFHI
jgi:hypothetical protein